MSEKDQSRIAALEAAEKLDELAEGALQDAMTLGRVARRLQSGGHPLARIVGNLRRYPERNHYRTDDVAEIIANLEAQQAPQHRKRLERQRQYQQPDKRRRAMEHKARDAHSVIRALKEAVEILENNTASDELLMVLDDLLQHRPQLCQSIFRCTNERIDARSSAARQRRLSATSRDTVVPFPGGNGAA